MIFTEQNMEQFRSMISLKKSATMTPSKYFWLNIDADDMGYGKRDQSRTSSQRGTCVVFDRCYDEMVGIIPLNFFFSRGGGISLE